MKKNNGFTLIEIVVAISIVAAIAFFAVPSLQSWYATIEAKKITAEINDYLYKARLNSINKNKVTQINFNNQNSLSNEDLPEIVLETKLTKIESYPESSVQLKFNKYGELINENGQNIEMIGVSSLKGNTNMLLMINAGSNLICNPKVVKGKLGYCGIGE